MKSFLDPAPIPPTGKVRWDNWGKAMTMMIVPHCDLSAIVDALNEPSFSDYRRAQCGAGKVSLSENGRFMHLFIGRDLTATLAVLRAQIARLTGITEWVDASAPEVPA